MKFSQLLEILVDESVFETRVLFAGGVNPADIRPHLCRWVRSGRLHKLRRGVYALAPPFRKVRPHPFLVANRLVRSSYVSLESALSYHGLIPDTVPVVTSVTTARLGRWQTPLGRYEFRHVKPPLFIGYRLTEVSPGQRAFLARPEKALLDLAYLRPERDTPVYLKELRLQNLEGLDLDELGRLAEKTKSPKLRRVAALVKELAWAESREYEYL